MPLKQPFNKPLRLLYPIFKKYRLRIIIGLLALVCVDLFQLLIPRVIKSAIDSIERSQATEISLRNHAMIIILFALGVAVFRFLWRYLILGFSRLLERDIRDSLFNHLLTLDRSFYQKKTTGELMALSSNDLSAVQLACGMGLVSFVDAVLMSIAVLFFMAYIDIKLTIIAMCPLPFLAFATRALSGKLHKRFKKVQEHFSKLTELARSTISSMRLIKIYTQEDHQTKEFDTLGKEYIKHSLNVAKVQGTLFPLSGLIANCSLILVVVLGGRMAIYNKISLGEFVAFISYLFMMTWPMMAIGWVANLFQRGMTSISRIQSILEEKPSLKSMSPSSSSLKDVKEIQLKDFHFTYPGQKHEIITGLNMTIDQGITGIVGKTGCGKSTLCHVLARLFPVAADQFLINRKDVNLFSLTDFRAITAYVPQEPLLFSNTIAFNISFGKPTATIEEIIHAAKQTGIHREIIAFPDGYLTRIGEKGVKLSGGQRQRISMARAILTDSPIIIIDDGLSAVDSVTEQHIIKNLKNISKNKIIIIISHRLTSLTLADKIAVIENGTVAAVGPHALLLEINPYYLNIYNNQSGHK